MNIFLDANILVSVLNKEYPLFHNTARILSLANNSKFKVYTSPICLSIAFYFAEKKHGRDVAKKKIALVTENILISSIDDSVVRKAMKNKAVKDVEDGFEYYSAIQSNCKCIITEDVHDFYFSTIEVLKAEQFELKYMR